MPRGKYDRKESRIKRLTKELNEAKKKVQQLRQTEVKTLPDRHQVTARDLSAISLDRFAILRDNLQSLTSARRTVIDLPGISPDVIGRLDYEISVHITMLANLRVETFQAPVAQAPASAPKDITPAVFQSQRPGAAQVRQAG